MAQGLSVCPKCGYHFPIGAYYRLSTILDPGTFRELNEKYPCRRPLHFPDYRKKLESAQRKTCLTEAAVTATGTIGGVKCVVGVLDSRFLMGSMSAAVGKNHPGHRVCRQEQASPHPLCRQRRRPDAGGHPLPDADGQDQRCPGPVL